MYNTLLKVCDILASTITVVSLFMVSKSYKWWLVYAVGSILFIIVTASNHIFGLTCMGTVLFFVGVNNYIKGRNEYKRNNR